jgi:hypothetical protein
MLLLSKKKKSCSLLKPLTEEEHVRGFDREDENVRGCDREEEHVRGFVREEEHVRGFVRGFKRLLLFFLERRSIPRYLFFIFFSRDALFQKKN